MYTLRRHHFPQRLLRGLSTRLLLMLAAGVLLASQALADPFRDRPFHDERGYSRDSGAWRLDDYQRIYLRTHRGWRQVEGTAMAVGDGWVIGTDRRPGGFGIYRWNGYRFERMPGAAVRIGGSYAYPWVINDRGQRFEWTGYDWQPIGGGRYRRGRW